MRPGTPRVELSRVALTAAIALLLSSCQSNGTRPGDNRSAGNAASASATPLASTSATPDAKASSSSAAKATSAARAPDRCKDVKCLSIERCDPASGSCKPNCPTGEVYVPATGTKGFIMGKGWHGKMDRPHKVVLTKPFCMDATEVTVGAYKKCVQAKACTKPRLWGMWRNYPSKDDHPVNKIDWPQTLNYCKWVKKSLPSEAQWEWATTEGDGRLWAWGDTKPTCKHADYTPGVLRTPSSDDGCHGGGTSPVGTHPAGDKVWPNGRIHDLTGNVWEWCLDNYFAYTGRPETDPVHLKAKNTTHVVRGGGWNRSHTGIRAHYRGGTVHTYQVPGLGFRCVRNP